MYIDMPRDILDLLHEARKKYPQKQIFYDLDLCMPFEEFRQYLKDILDGKIIPDDT